jgi:hypothetical protein
VNGDVFTVNGKVFAVNGEVFTINGDAFFKTRMQTATSPFHTVGVIIKIIIKSIIIDQSCWDRSSSVSRRIFEVVWNVGALMRICQGDDGLNEKLPSQVHKWIAFMHTEVPRHGLIHTCSCA